MSLLGRNSLKEAIEVVDEAVIFILAQGEGLCLDSEEDRERLSNALSYGIVDSLLHNGHDVKRNYIEEG